MRAAGILLAAALLGCAAPAPRAERRAAPDEDLLALLPAGAEAVLDVETGTLRGLPEVRRIVSALPDALQAMAVDPLEDLQAVAVSVSGLGTPQLEVVVVARGRPSWVRLSGALRARIPEAAEVDYHGVAVLEARDGQAAAMLTPRSAVLGSRAAVRQVIDNLQGETSGLRGHAPLMAALAKAPRARLGRPALLGAVVPPEELRARLREADLGELGADADYLAAALAAGDGIDLGVVAGFRDLAAARAAARHLQERVEGLRRRQIVRLLGLGPLIDPLIIVAAMAGPQKQEPELHLAYRLPGEDWTSLVGKVDQLRTLWPGGKAPTERTRAAAER